MALLMVILLLIASLPLHSFASGDNVSEDIEKNIDKHIAKEIVEEVETTVELKVNTGTEEEIAVEDMEIQIISVENYAEELKDLGILKGTDKGLELDSELTRVQAMLVYFRLLGVNPEKLEDFVNSTVLYKICPFEDVPSWAWDEISYLYNLGLVKGVSETKLGSEDKMTVEQFVTLILRALDYDDNNGDFIWNESLEKAMEIGLLPSDKIEHFKTSEAFTRGDMSYITYNALRINLKNQNKTLLEVRDLNEETMEPLLGDEVINIKTEEVLEEVEPQN